MLMVVLGVAAGCGGDESSSADAGSSNSQSSPSSAAEPVSEEPEAPDVPAANLTQVELIPDAFPLADIPTVDGTVISALDSSVAINAELDREAAFAEAVTRMEAAGYVAERMEEIDAEATFVGRGLTVRLFVVADGPDNAGVNYLID